MTHKRQNIPKWPPKPQKTGEKGPENPLFQIPHNNDYDKQGY
jgi:hypothetical protein